jgi:glyoxylase-like metal-dependent hydrolase (beta-lactamase superfamily II)
MRLLRQDPRCGEARGGFLSDMAMLVDLDHIGRPGVIGAWLLDGPEPALVDCGPASCVDALLRGLHAHAVDLADVRHLVLTHIHPDHCGAAGGLVRRYPHLQVHVHVRGAPHLVDPGRLEESARALYGAAFDRLFGHIEAVPAANVRVLGAHLLDLEAFPTPGHARHHVSFLGSDGACYTGDAAGVLIPPGGFLYPAAAPPGIDLDAWEGSLAAIEERRPTVLRLAHFGEVVEPASHLARMRAALRRMADRVRGGQTVAEFVASSETDLVAGGGDPTYVGDSYPGFDLTYDGLRRAVEKQR